MKKLISLFISLAFAGSTFAQMSGYSSSSYSDGTTLGANETLTADGIALGNAVKLRGYVDFRLQRIDSGNDGDDTTHAHNDTDFLINLSPVTAEVHLNVSENNSGFLVFLNKHLEDTALTMTFILHLAGRLLFLASRVMNRLIYMLLLVLTIPQIPMPMLILVSDTTMEFV